MTVSEPKFVTTELTAVIKDLAACESYTFDIGLVGPYGLGPLSGHLPTKVTYFNTKAPPKNLRVFTEPTNVTMMSITWSSSCPIMRDNVSYIVSFVIIC